MKNIEANIGLSILQSELPMMRKNTLKVVVLNITGPTIKDLHSNSALKLLIMHILGYNRTLKM